ncbi:urease accessory protein UreD [Halorubrum saccharovorum DSM 1137]|uniref:Urease accessory protein UreD n=1 Tax=Halorubrum saccharovorum DSM 1137 TaxID=1227484 RepID=M0E5V9_9EURY|nr:urease accessory protein UreD [Halorubrum saccharovorum]ELZ42302.1 urease accessory protein UreD [Halorubrum saccharovorum DSM 1137]
MSAADDPADDPVVPPAFREYGDQPLPQSPAFGHGKNGIADLVLGREGDNPTRLLSDLVKVPYHLTGTLDSDPAPGLTTVCLQEPTGGVAQGDRHSLSVEARSGARAHVTTQSATKVHSMKANYAHLDATLVAESGAYLEYVPGPTIVNEDARCLQTTTVEMAPDASVVVGDIFVPDGLTDHEPFGFEHYHSRLEASVDDDLVCADAVDLRPAERDPRDPATVGDYAVVGTLYAFAPTAADVDALADALHDRLADHEVAAGASLLKDDAGVTVRVLGDRSTDVTAAVEAAWDETREALLGVGAPLEGRGR